MWEPFNLEGMMDKGCFYFLSDSYCSKFDKYGIMSNKGENHGRPCYYYLQDKDNEKIFWMIPISSKVKKYREINKKKLEKYNIKSNNGLEFGYVRGREAAFLIQNICPVIEQDIYKKYIDINTGKPVSISEKTQKRVNRKARQVISLTKKGIQCTITKIPDILKELDIE